MNNEKEKANQKSSSSSTSSPPHEIIDETQKIIQVADGRTIELGTNYHYRWTRDWDVDYDDDGTESKNNLITNNSNNNNNSKDVREKPYSYRSFWDKVEFRASCSLLYGFTLATPEFAELTAPVI